MKIKCNSNYPDYLVVNAVPFQPGLEGRLVFETADGSEVKVKDCRDVTVHLCKDEARKLANAILRWCDGGQFEEVS